MDPLHCGGVMWCGAKSSCVRPFPGIREYRGEESETRAFTGKDLGAGWGGCRGGAF